MQKFLNNYSTTLTAAITNSDTSLAVDNITPVDNLSMSSPDYLLLTIDDGTNIEIVKCEGVFFGELSITERGVDGTTASPFPNGSKVECNTTAGTLDNLQNKLTIPSSVIFEQTLSTSTLDLYIYDLDIKITPAVINEAITAVLNLPDVSSDAGMFYSTKLSIRNAVLNGLTGFTAKNNNGTTNTDMSDLFAQATSSDNVLIEIYYLNGRWYSGLLAK